jgi:hypothetical protein
VLVPGFHPRQKKEKGRKKKEGRKIGKKEGRKVGKEGRKEKRREGTEGEKKCKNNPHSFNLKICSIHFTTRCLLPLHDQCMTSSRAQGWNRPWPIPVPHPPTPMGKEDC